MSIQENTFAEACYNQNTIAELESALKGEADTGDMDAWSLTAEEWREQVKAALQAKKEDEE